MRTGRAREAGVDLTQVSADVIERARRVRVAAFDVDGVLTDGRLYYSAQGEESKSFHTLDGLGLKLLRSHGIEVALITARSSRAVEHRARELGIDEVHQGTRDKLALLREVCARHDAACDAAAYTGDDLPDLAPMAHAALAIAVANAHEAVLARAHWRTTRRGGEGAVREVCDLLLAAQGKADAAIAAHLAGPV